MSFNGWQGQIETKRLAVVLTRRELLAGAIAISGSTLVAKASPSRSVNPEFKSAMTTLFWVGERSNAENNFIPNHESYWDTDWQTSYGGVDDPEHRNGYWPAGFRPKENPFYVALPYGEFTEADCLKTSASRIPWYRFGLSPLLKNRWVQIGWSARSCFAQLQDVGPCGEDDFEFVFGNAALPSNAFGAKAGLDVSPGVRRYLGMNHNNLTYWRFADESDVLEGPWMEIVTTSGNNR
jgi:hypothetical protein